MSQNATHVIIRHYIDGPSSLYLSMVCCIVLIIIVVIVLCFFLGFAIYIVVVSKKSRQLSEDQPLRRVTKDRENNLARNFIEDASSYNAVGTPISTAQEFDVGADANVQSMPLSTFRRHTVNDRVGNISQSSELIESQLYKVLFPNRKSPNRKPGGESDFQLPNKLVSFAGQVYASGEGSSQTNLIAGPSTSGLAYDNTVAYDNASGSLEWDYFPTQQDSCIDSAQSEVESGSEAILSKTLSWV